MDDDELIASFYAAATGAIPWPRALDGLAYRLSCDIVQIIGVDLERRRLTYSHEGGAVPAGAVLDYALRYHRDDPHVPEISARPLAELVSFSKIFGERYVATNRFYQDFLIPYGVRHMHAARLSEDAGRAAMVGIMRSATAGALEGDDWLTAQRLTFHLSRAAQIHEVRIRDTAEVAIGLSVLDRLAAPTWIVDDRRRLLRCNRAATAAAAGRNVLRVDAAEELHAVDPADNERFGQALQRLTAGTGAGAPAASDTSDREVLPMTRGGRSFVVRLLAIRADQTLHAFGSSAVAMVMLHDPRSVEPPDLFLLAAAFRLSPAEARVALGLFAGRTAKQIAREGGVSLYTVQSQIKSACFKAGVNRTVDLVSAIHAVSAGVSA